MDSERTVLVIGATGNIGRHVVSLLRDEGVHVRALVRRPEGGRGIGAAGVRLGVDEITGDLRDPASVAARTGPSCGPAAWR
jgi:uncharacterized protein YbjT (DUF2867 family)